MQPGDLEKKLPPTLEEILDPTLMVMLEAILDETGYQCLPYPEYPEPPKIGIGWYTFPGKKVIFYNPHDVEGKGPAYAFAIFAHEMGHHHPDLVKFQDTCQAMGINFAHLFKGILPIAKIIQVLNNASADIYLEERNAAARGGLYHGMMSKLYRRALAQDFLRETPQVFEDYKDDLSDENFPWQEAAGGDGDSFLFQQFMNGFLLMAKFGLPPDGIFDPRVKESLKTAYESMDIIRNGNKRQVSVMQKVHAQIKIFHIAAHLVNLDADTVALNMADATAKMEAVLDKFLNGMEPHAMVTEDPDSSGEPETSDSTTDHKDLANSIKSALIDASRTIDAMQAAQIDVPPEQLADYMHYVNEYRFYIERLKEILIEFILKDREMQITPGHRDGFMIEPGMEALTYYGIMSGDFEPPTILDAKEQPRSLSLEAALILDTSGSMYPYTDGMLGLLATLMESIRMVHETVTNEPQRYNWKEGDKMPASLELTVFADKPEVVLPMSALLSLREVVVKFNEMQKRGGGTVTHEALNFEYDRLTANDDDGIVRVLTLITDGQDGGPLLDKIVKKIVEDPRIYFLVVGIGPDQEVRDSIVNVYRRHFKPQSSYRLFANGYPNVLAGLSSVISFFNHALEQQKGFRDALTRGMVVSG